MDFINKRVQLFQKLVINHFAKKYCLNTVFQLKLLQPKSMYVNNNCILVHNSILNQIYNLDLDIKKYSIIFILYKNINFRKLHDEYIPRLDSRIKTKIINNFKKLKRNDINNEIVFIGRKYTNVKDKSDKIVNCFGLYCTRDIDNISKSIRNSENENGSSNETDNDSFDDTKTDNDSFDDTKTDNDSFDDTKTDNDSFDDTKTDNDSFDDTKTDKSMLRRKFLMNLKSMITSRDNIYNLIRNGVFVDVEFTNDIYDDFKTFPISIDTSVMFMIGVSCLNKGSICYNDFTVNRLCKIDERYILTKFLDFVENKWLKTNMCVLLFHWSNADKYAIEKSLQRYPELYLRYQNMLYYIQYVDLLYVLKKTIPLHSYSLKYVSKYFLNISYESECQNGLDAMCSIIKNEISLQKCKETKTLSYFPSTADIIHYNKIDTTLLYRVLQYFIY
jgi:hypothetical protein